ncbi:MAG: peptidoglycan DD-metalloendopeptidase family protein [Deltaproteobacteria bacterium]|nr:peptidoglycan DD-metalloendopeptidase family protein [Deltaproteobacteria bacterium]
MKPLGVVFVLLSACAPFVDDVVYGNREPQELLPVIEGEGIFHTVQAGETAFRIAKAYGVALDDLLGQNDLSDPKKLRTGDVLFIAGATAVVAIAPAPPPKAGEPAPDEAAERAAVLAQIGKLEWPVDGIVTTRFGVRGSRKHDGIDISAPEGTRVAAAGTGVVLYAGDGQRGYGNLIIIKHEQNLVTVYAHNKENFVKEGDRVARGQVIAHVGQTGRAEGPHLHFEVRQTGRAKNPLFYLP